MIPAAPVSIFLSYSHKDEKWKDRLVTQLQVLEKTGRLSLWEDRQIKGGDEWLATISRALDDADVAILMVSAQSLTSEFILRNEVPRLIERREREGVRVFPVIVEPCAWSSVPWLARLQVLPKDGRPLSKGTRYQAEASLAAIVDEISRLTPRSVQLGVDVDLRVWDRKNTARFGAKVDDGAALPLCAADPFSITIRLNTSAYVYAVWVGSDGKVQPLHPWIKGEWGDYQPLAPSSSVELPGRRGDLVKTWSIDTPEGFDTLVVMVRDESLGDLSTRMYQDLPHMFPCVGPTLVLPASEQSKPLWSEFRQVSSVQPERARVLFKESNVRDAISQVLKLHQVLRDRLGSHFSVLKVGSFANAGIVLK